VSFPGLSSRHLTWKKTAIRSGHRTATKGVFDFLHLAGWPASKAQASRGLAAMAQEGLFDCVESAKPGPTFFVFDSQHPVWPKPQLPSTTTMRLCLIQA